MRILLLAGALVPIVEPTGVLQGGWAGRWQALRIVAAGACLLAFLSASVLVGVSLLQPETNPFFDTVSLLVLGPGGFLVSAMMVAAGTSIVVVAVALRLAMQRTFWSMVGTTMLAMGGVQVLVMGFFPTDPGVVPVTLIGMVHATLSGMGLVMIPLSFVLLSWLFRRDPAWGRLWRPALAVAALSMAASVAYGVLSYVDGHTTLWRPVYDGLAERILVGTIMVWLVLASVSLWGLASQRQQEST